MSTRAVIARQTSDGWEGVYNHSDGYPTALGQELWLSIHAYDILECFLREVIDAHPGGWSHFVPAIPRDLWEEYAASGYSPDFFARHAVRECYCHTRRLIARADSPDHARAPSGRITYDPSADGAGDLEWAYCFGSGRSPCFRRFPPTFAASATAIRSRPATSTSFARTRGRSSGSTPFVASSRTGVRSSAGSRASLVAATWPGHISTGRSANG